MSISDLWLDALASALALAFAAWRFPFVRESAPVSLIFGCVLFAVYLAPGLVLFLLGDSSFLRSRSMLAAFGLGLAVHSIIVFLFGKRLRA